MTYGRILCIAGIVVINRAKPRYSGGKRCPVQLRPPQTPRGHILCHLISNIVLFCCSGLTLYATDEISGRGVTPIYLRCSQGHLEWLYPRGALRVLLRFGASGRDFRGCVKVSGGFSGAHIFLEGSRSLLPLFPALQDGGSVRLARCFQSRHGQAALYVEAISSRGDIQKQVAAFSYNLQPLPRGRSYYDAQEGMSALKLNN